MYFLRTDSIDIDDLNNFSLSHINRSTFKQLAGTSIILQLQDHS